MCHIVRKKEDIYNTTTQKPFFSIFRYCWHYLLCLFPVRTYMDILPFNQLKTLCYECIISFDVFVFPCINWLPFPHTQKSQLFSILQYLNNASHLSVWLRHLLPCCLEGSYILLQTSVIVFKILGFIPVLYMSESFAEL